MTERHDREMTWTVREDESTDDLAHLTGIAVPWDSPTSIGNAYREQFARGAFDLDQVVGRPLYWRHSEVIGRITHARDSDAGLDVDATILPTRLGNDAMILLRGDAVTGLSVGFEPLETDEADGIVTRTAARLLELSLTPVPAYDGATVTAHREETPMPDTTPEVTTTEVVDTEAREAVAALADTVATMTPTTVEVRESHPLAVFPTFGHYLHAVATAKAGGDVEHREALTRALDTASTSNNPGTIPPAWVADIVRQHNAGRPTVAAIGARALPSTGMKVMYRVVTQSTTVSSQAEGTEVSSQALTIGSGEATVTTQAGGVRVSMQEVMRSDPAYLSELQTDMVTSWNKQTNALLLAGMGAAASGTGAFAAALDTANIGATLGTAAADIAAAGGRMTTIILGPSLFFEIAAVSGQGYPFAGGDVATAALNSVSFTAFGVRFVMDPQATTNGYALDTDAVRFWEAGPYFMQADEPGILSRDVAIFSYNAEAVTNPAAVIKITKASTRR